MPRRRIGRRRIGRRILEEEEEFFFQKNDVAVLGQAQTPEETVN
jgi:hypothetical protein